MESLQAALMAKTLAGPPAPRGRRDNLPRVMRPEDEKRNQKSDLLAALLAAAGATDLMATEAGLSRNADSEPLTPGELVKFPDLDPNTKYVWDYPEEANPLPGMQHPIGRLAWGAVENKGLQMLRDKKPGVGVPATVLATIAHLLLADRWRRDINKTER